MDSIEYRNQLEAAIEAARAAISIPPVATGDSDPASREAAIVALDHEAIKDDAQFGALLGQLTDPSEDASLRFTILGKIQSLGFGSVSFGARRPEWLAALRTMIADPDPQLRSAVLDCLSIQKDAQAQSILLNGLKDPAVAVVPPERALQLLANDIHTDAYLHARNIIDDAPSDAARLEAVRLLAADSESVPLLEELLLDQSELPEVRRLAIAALHSLDQATLHEHAHTILMSDDEHPDVISTSLMALVHNDAAPRDDLAPRVDELMDHSSAEIAGVAAQLSTRFSSAES